MKSLQNISYKTLFTILFFAIAGIVFFLKIGGKTSKVSAAWWDHTWHYRKAVDISNPSGINLTDFQVAISINTSQLITEGKMQNNCNDIRITDQNGNLLSYWIDPGTSITCNKITTTIWTKISNIPSSGGNIYLYYGNPNATSIQNPHNTFDHFEDFNEASTPQNAGFIPTVGNWIIENGMLKTSSVTYDSNIYWSSAGSLADYVFMWDGITTGLPAGAGYSWGAGAALRLNPSTGQYDNSAVRTLWHPEYTDVAGAHRFEGGIFESTASMGFRPLINQFYRGTFQVYGNSVKFNLSNIPFGGSNNYNRSSSNGYLRASGYVGAHSNLTVSYWDWFAIRKYTNTPPNTTPQSEEVGIPEPINTAWWDHTWHYRKAVNISNTTGSNLTDFQVAISVDTSQLVAEGKMQNNCNDIRITDINGDLLPHWIETNGLNACNQINSIIWLKISSLPTSGSTIYFYYGNPSAMSNSNGNNVFEFFDNFDNSSIDLNKWNLSGTMLSISNNRLRADRANGTGSLFSKITFSKPFILDYDFYPTQYPYGWEGGYHGTMSFGTYNTSFQTEHAWIPHGGGGNSYVGLCDDGGCYHGGFVNPATVGNTLYKINMQIQPNRAGPQGYMTYSNHRDDNTGSEASGTVTTSSNTGDNPLYIGINDYGGNTTDDFEWDNWRIRKYASSDPTSSFQSEETGIEPEPIDAPWWNSLWHYRKAISISNTSGSNQNNVQIKILKNYDMRSLVSEGKLQSDLDDLRFIDINGNLINYWIEDATNSSVDVWGILSSLPTPNTTIYMYYGNPSATSISGTQNMTIGGTMTSVGGYRIHTFKNSGTLTNTNNTNANVLVVAGGGGGTSGGGGGGGVLLNTIGITPQTYTITIGNGGNGGTANGGAGKTNGQNSTFASLTAIGGGAGGANDSTNSANSGGSGGGGGSTSTVPTNGGIGTPNQGNNGGTVTSSYYSSPYPSAGGGGAGSIGSNPTGASTSGNGGIGISSTISGVATFYAGGGGGSTWSNGTHGIGGAGGGGNGGYPNGTAGTTNTGGGGGGGAGGGGGIGGIGGSGIVIIQFPSGASTNPSIEEDISSTIPIVSINPIAYWKFDEGNGNIVHDSSSNKKHGTLPSNNTWWNDTWQYRQAINIGNTGAVQTTNSLFKILNNYNLSSLVTNGKMNSSLNDIRFTDTNGNLLNYWIEDNTNNSADVWLLIPSIPTGGTTIYMYYGNPSAINTSTNSWLPSGGTISISGNYRIHSFTTTGNLINTINSNVEYLIVAGGGGGTSGGGGGGGVLLNTIGITPQTYTITIGNGGNGGTANGGAGKTNGQNSTFASLTAIGGGAGGANDSTNSANSGGSGGGGGSTSTVPTNGGIGTPNQGNNGGTVTSSYYSSPYPSAGGGGAGSIGSNPTGASTSGNGGIGISSTISGVATFYAGGGGGSTWSNGTHGIGGAGGGGNGGYPNGTAGTTNTGGGGGGGAGGGGGIGGIGGSGIVIIRYLANTTNSSFESEETNTPVSDSPVWKNENECVSGKCMAFDSTDDGVSINKNFVGLTDYTMAAWINIKGNHKNHTGTIISSGNWDTNHWAFGINQNNSAISLHNNPSKNYAFQLNKWTYVSVTRSESTFTYYIDGKSIGTAIGDSTPLVSDTTNTTIGRETYNDGYFAFNGWIDELKIYNYARNADEIKLDYNSRGAPKGSSVNLGIQSNTSPSQGTVIKFGSTTQKINGIITSLDYCIPGDTSHCTPPVAEWNFEENTGTIAKDTSGNNNNGTFGTGDASPIWALGANNKGAGLKFDGVNDYLNCGNDASLNLTNNFTVEGWIYRTSASGVYDGIFSKKTGTDVGFHLLINPAGLLVFPQYNSGAQSNNAIPLNTWVHIVAIQISGVNKLYVNGVLQTITGTYSIGTNSEPFAIGRLYSSTGTWFFNGSIDNVKIYNYARTPAQIAYDYNKGAPVGWWKFDECQGNIANDSSGNNNHGTINIGSGGAQNSLGTCQVGTSTAWTNGANGHTNGSLNFDGVDDYVEITDSPSLNSTDNITVSAWVYSTNYNQNAMLVMKNPVNSIWQLYLESNKIKWRGGGISGDLIKDLPSNNHWHNILVTQTGTLATMYVDGVNKGSATTVSLGSSNSNINIGKFNNTYFFNGQIDDVRIYNYALTAEQVKLLYNGGAVNFK